MFVPPNSSVMMTPAQQEPQMKGNFFNRLRRQGTPGKFQPPRNQQAHPQQVQSQTQRLNYNG